MQLLTCPWTLTVTMRASHQLKMSKESSTSNCSGKNTDTHPLADMCLDFALWFSESVMHDEMLNLSFMFVGFRILWEEASKEIWAQQKGKSKLLDIWLKTKEGYGEFSRPPSGYKSLFLLSQSLFFVSVYGQVCKMWNEIKSSETWTSKMVCWVLGSLLK